MPRTRGCAGATRPSRSAAWSGRAPRRPARGRYSTAPGSSCGRSPASAAAIRTWPPASCASADRRHWSAPGPGRSSSATCRHTASAGCRPPTGCAGCAPARPARCSADMPPRAPTRSANPARPARRRADPARTVAFKALCAVSDRDAYVNLLLPTLLRDSGLTGRDAALATELAYGTLRGQGSYDAILAICSDRDLDRIDPPVRQVLRLGAHQLLANRIGAHAAVATSSREADLAGYLSVAYSHPRWIVGALSEALAEDPAGGLAETEAVLAADGERPRVTLCAVPGLADPAELVAAGATPGQWSPFAAVLAEGDPAQIAAVAQGRAAVQDEASQLAALALARVDVDDDAGSAGARWLDMCAGPG